MTTIIKALKVKKTFLAKSQVQSLFCRSYKEKRVYYQMLVDNLNIDVKQASELVKDGSLTNFTKDHIVQNCQVLQKTGVHIKEKEPTGKVLGMKPLLLEHRILLLQELGVKDIDMSFLTNYRRALSFSTSLFKAHLRLPASHNLAESIFSYLKNPPPVPQIDDNVSVNELCEICMKCYIKSQLDISEKEESNIWKDLYLARKSFRMIERTISIIRNDIGFSKAKLKKNMFLLSAHPDDMIPVFQRLEQAGFNPIVLINRYPLILCQSSREIDAILLYIKGQGISDLAIRVNPEVLIIPSDVFVQRVEELLRDPDMSVFKHHTQFLKLVHLFARVQARLTYLRDVCNTQSAPMAILTSGTDIFIRFLQQTQVRADLTEIVALINEDLKMDAMELKKKIKAQSYWKYSSFHEVKRTYEYLKKYFSLQAIYRNVYIVFYPVENVKEIISTVQSKYSDAGRFCLTPNQWLALCMYHLEVDNHFTGDGVFNRQQLDEDLLESDCPVERE